MKSKIFILSLLLTTSIVLTASTKKKDTTVKGKVYEMVDGVQKPLAMAYVYVNNTENWSYSNEDGVFDLNIPKGTDEIKVSFKGFKSEAYKIDDKTDQVNIVLIKDENLFTEK